MTYDEALEYIHGTSNFFCKPGLERIGALCRALGDPQDSLKYIHVAGTNGKGSTSSMLASILKEAGYKVGLYTSPYIYRFNERIKVDGKDISDGDLVELVERVKPIADAMTDKPTEFELITAIAFLHFKRCGCDIVVLEVGMGGRFDATNIIKSPLLSIITGIALDHTAFLGDTVEKIAYEKAGIIKSGSPVLWCGRDAAAERVIREIAEERGCEFYRVRYELTEVHESTLAGTRFSYGEYRDVLIRLLGAYQPHNASGVLEAVEILRKNGVKIDTGAVYRGLAATRWRARFEVIATDPTVIFDGAHNPEGIAAAVESIKNYYPQGRVTVFTGVLADKDYRTVARSIAEVASSAYTITPDNPRALSAEDYAEVLRGYGVDALPCESVEAALGAAIERARRDGGAVCCLGSLYTYSSVIDALGKIKN